MEFVYPVICILCVVLAVWAWRHIKTSKRRRSLLGVQLLQAIRMLVKHIQLHRGLTSVYLAGEKSVRDRITSTADQVSAHIGEVAQLDQTMLENHDWLAVTQHWARLSAGLHRYDTGANYDQHCKLIASCLALMVEIHRIFGVKGNGKAGEHIHWYELLCLGEKLGQLRALGVMLLTRSTPNDSNVTYQMRVAHCLREVDKIYRSKYLQVKIGDAVCEKVSVFLATVEHDIVGGRAMYSSDQYFAKASETIDLIYERFDSELQALVRKS